MSSHSGLLLLISVWASLHDGLALPLTELTDVEAGDGVVVPPHRASDAAVVPPHRASDTVVVPPHRVRTKRCSCSNQLDSECHYFCHLDIIWINTPSKTTIYGLGSALSRRRRSTGRCACANSADHSCASFCHNSPDITSPKNGGSNMAQTNVLSILRSVASMSARLRDAALLSRSGPDLRREASEQQQNDR